MCPRKCFYSLFRLCHKLHCLRNQVLDDDLSNVSISVRSIIYHQVIITPWHRLLPLSGSHGGGGVCSARFHMTLISRCPKVTFNLSRRSSYCICTHGNRFIIAPWSRATIYPGIPPDDIIQYTRTIFEFIFFVSILQGVKLTQVSRP